MAPSFSLKLRSLLTFIYADHNENSNWKHTKRVQLLVHVYVKCFRVFNQILRLRHLGWIQPCYTNVTPKYHYDFSSVAPDLWLCNVESRLYLTFPLRSAFEIM